MSSERRERVTAANFTEAGYLAANPDVAAAVTDRVFASGREHFELHGKDEERFVLLAPSDLRSRATRLVRRAADRLPGRDLERRFDALEARVHDLEVVTRQQEALLGRFHGMLTPPPKHLQERVVGRYTASFVDSGFDIIVPALARSLGEVGRDLAEMTSILDFGCGCGRAIVPLRCRLPGATIHGTDIDDEAITWCRTHLAELASFTVAPHAPPLGYDDESFDFVYGISVLTHLPEEMQFDWLAELRRITKAGGVVVLTTHGTNHHAKLPPSQRAVLDRDGFVYLDAGQDVSLPDFYQTAMHTHDYIRSRWSAYFDVLAIQPIAMEQHQDVVVLLKR